MTALSVSNALLPGYTITPIDAREGELIRCTVHDSDGQPAGTVAHVAWPLQVGHRYGWIRADRSHGLDAIGELVDIVRALPRVRWPGREIDQYDRPVYRDSEVPPVDAAFAQWRGRTCAHSIGMIVGGLSAERHEQAQRSGQCVGGWMVSGEWWLHCGTCRPDISAIERLEYRARDRFLNPHLVRP